ncbi:unnamed protein product [Chironomus riparius]|uniref:Ionotropic receptor n=1 Tax=Chironomus riparius TaxID=315576 RepID=A0A9N9RZI7_9DIPT|nr:unnamed protein product [Chironomus riparius]
MVLSIPSCIVCKIAPEQEPKPVISQPVVDIIDALFVKNDIPFDIIIYGGFSDQTLDIFDQLPSLAGMNLYIALYQYFLIRSQNGLELVTFEWYTDKVCNVPMIIPINTFDTNLMKWKNELKIPGKFRQFYGCMLTIGVAVGRMHVDLDVSNNLVGPPIDLFKAMASVGNFTINHQHIQKPDGLCMQPIAQNGQTLDIQVYFQMPRVAFSRFTDVMHLTTVFLGESVTFLLTEPEAYSSYEKLVLPFDTLTWIFSIAVFLGAFVCIFIINLISPTMQNLFYGEHVTSPALNVIGIYFGSSQISLPFRNFPRIILVTFIMFCLVLRTAYQGVLFEMVAGDIRKPLPKTVDDLYKMNYTITIGDDLEESMEETIPEDRRPNVIVMNIADQEIEIMHNISNSALKFAHCSYEKMLQCYQNHFPESGGFLKEHLYSFITGFMLYHFHFLFELTDETVQALLTGGILQHSFEMEDFKANHEVHSMAMNIRSMTEKSKVMTMDDLSYGFTLWMFSCLITFIVFLVEMTTFYLGFGPFIYYFKCFVNLVVLKICTNRIR